MDSSLPQDLKGEEETGKRGPSSGGGKETVSLENSFFMPQGHKYKNSVESRFNGSKPNVRATTSGRQSIIKK